MPKTKTTDGTETKPATAAELLPKHCGKVFAELIEVHGKQKASQILKHAATMIEYPGSENMVGGLYLASLAMTGGMQ